MGLFSGMAKAGLAKKVIDEGRKPENQRKIKGLFASMSGKRKRPGTSAGGTRRG